MGFFAIEGIRHEPILADHQVLELRIRQGQVHVLRRRKAEDRFPNWELGGEATDDIRCYVVTRGRRYAVTRAGCDAVTGAQLKRAHGRPPATA